MTITTHTLDAVSYAQVESDEVLIVDTQSALDLMMNVRFQADTERIALSKATVAEDFFILSTGLAGEVLQKFVNYGVKLAIYGDFSRYTSKPLRDFIGESNRGRHVFFTSTAEEAGRMLCRV
jgi:hypothetical protein